MSNYSTNPHHVRCDMFKESGKWMETFSLDIEDWKGELRSEIIKALKCIHAYPIEGNIGDGRFYVILDPYNEHSHPVSLKEEYINWQEDRYGSWPTSKEVTDTQPQITAQKGIASITGSDGYWSLEGIECAKRLLEDKNKEPAE